MTQFVRTVFVACMAVVLTFDLSAPKIWSQESIDATMQSNRDRDLTDRASVLNREAASQFFASDIGVLFENNAEPAFELASVSGTENRAAASNLQSTNTEQQSAESFLLPPPRPEGQGFRTNSSAFESIDSLTSSTTVVPTQDAYISEIPPVLESENEANECSHVAGACRCSCQHCRRNCGTRLGRFCYLVTQGICCPDPCYRSEWTMVANASFFTDAVQPQNRQRFRWDFNNNFRFPDRAEYLWGRGGVTGPAAETSIDYHELTYFVETGGDKLSLFIETPYRSIDLGSGGHFAGFADLTTGTKTLLHDTELLQISTQFEVHIPSANPAKGLSNGHVTLKPGLLLGIKTSEQSYLQMKIAEGIPIAGDPDFAGAYLSYSASLNRVVWGDVSSTSLIRTLEYTGVTFQDGAFTDTTAGNATTFTSGESFGLLGSGLRLNICNKLNFGIGTQFRVTDISPDATIRTEIQFRH